jgi:hypothetical protein
MTSPAGPRARPTGNPCRSSPRSADVACSRLHPLFELVELRLAQHSRQPHESPIVLESWIIEPLAVSDQCAEDRADLQQLLPIAIVARQAGGIKAEHQANTS